MRWYAQAGVASRHAGPRFPQGGGRVGSWPVAPCVRPLLPHQGQAGAAFARSAPLLGGLSGRPVLAAPH
eukprot:4337474-Lingulodinium_polyedra.AAC.1